LGILIVSVRTWRDDISDRIRKVVEARAHILLVDDETEFLFSAGVALGKAGYRVSVAVSGEEALNLILRAEKKRNPLRLLITDIRLPGMSGLGLIDALRERRIFLPVLAITGFGDRILYGELSARGCMERIDKPFEPEDLLKKVRRMVDEESSREVTA
jgi:DNA-binding NtrC family response regulator